MVNIDTMLDFTVYQYDFGVPVVFELIPEEGVSLIGDTVVLCFGTDKIDDKTVPINTDDYNIEFALTKEEADSLFTNDIRFDMPIPYSLKRLKGDQYLSTICDGIMTVRRTVKWKEQTTESE